MAIDDGQRGAARVGVGGIAADDWERVRVVLERLALSSDLNSILALVIDSVRDCLHAERASVFQYDKGSHELFATKAHGVDQSLRFSADRGIAGEAVRTGQIINVPDCYADPRFNPEIDRKTGYRTRCMLTIPMMSFDGGLEGVAQVLNKDVGQGGVFDAVDETLARALASQAAVAMRRSRLIEAERQKNKYEADLAVARLIQRSTLPQEIPVIPGYDIAAVTKPADETGGDTFDVVDLLRLPKSHMEARAVSPSVMVLMADATGHGIGPALSVTQVRSMLRMAMRLGAPLENLGGQVNAQLCEDLPAGRFVTAFFGMLMPREHVVRYLAAGQAPILVLRADGTFESHAANAMPLGIDPEMTPEAVEPIVLAKGDMVAVLSDGFFEAQNPANEWFGEEAVVRCMLENRGRAAGEIISAVMSAADVFCQGRPAADDQTAVIIKRVS